MSNRPACRWRARRADAGAPTFVPRLADSRSDPPGNHPAARRASHRVNRALRANATAPWTAPRCRHSCAGAPDGTTGLGGGALDKRLRQPVVCRKSHTGEMEARWRLIRSKTVLIAAHLVIGIRLRRL